MGRGAATGRPRRASHKGRAPGCRAKPASAREGGGTTTAAGRSASAAARAEQVTEAEAAVDEAETLSSRRGTAHGAASRRSSRPSGRQDGTEAVRGVAWQPSRMLKNARVFGPRADLACKLRVKMHVGRLGVKWAAR